MRTSIRCKRLLGAHGSSLLAAAAAAALILWSTIPTRAGTADGIALPLDSPGRRSAPLTLGEPALPLPPVHTAVLDNGVRMFLVERHDLPIATVRVLATRGTADAPPGVAFMAAHALFSGTYLRSSPEINGALKMIGSEVQFDSSYEAIWANAEVLSSRVGDVLTILADLFQHTQMPAAWLSAVRPTLLLEAKRRGAGGDVRIRTAIASSLYPESHPYRQGLYVDENTLGSVTRDDVITFFKTQVQPDTTVVVVVGDVERFKLENMVQAAFGSWKGHAVSRQAMPESFDAPRSPRIAVVDLPGATQATVMVGQLGVSRFCPDREALLVINAILGEMSGRLHRDLRETKGSTYSAMSWFEMGRGPGPFLVEATVAPEGVSDVISLVMAHVRRITSEPVTPDELAYGKALVRGSLPIQFIGLGGTVDALAKLATFDRPLEDYTRLSARLAALTPEQLLRVAQRYLKPAELRAYVVADAARVRGPLKALEIGPVQVERPTENPSKAPVGLSAKP